MNEEEDGDNSFSVSYLNEDVVIASACRLLECGIEHLEIICGGGGGDLIDLRGEKEKSERKKSSDEKKKIKNVKNVYELTSKIVRLLLSWSKDNRIRVASSAMASLSM